MILQPITRIWQKSTKKRCFCVISHFVDRTRMQSRLVWDLDKCDLRLPMPSDSTQARWWEDRFLFDWFAPDCSDHKKEKYNGMTISKGAIHKIKALAVLCMYAQTICLPARPRWPVANTEAPPRKPGCTGAMALFVVHCRTVNWIHNIAS